jgi:RNA polymerase sigma-70 factor (ECF subfamily)
MQKDPARPSTGAIEAQLPFIRRHARALVQDRDAADSLVRACLERAVSGRGSVQEDRVRGETDLRIWLLRLLHEEHAHRAPETVPTATWPDGVESAELRRFRLAFDRLPAEDRQILLLTGLEGLTTEESSKVLGIDTATACLRAVRARKRLRLLQGEMGAPMPADRAGDPGLAVGSAA